MEVRVSVSPVLRGAWFPMHPAVGAKEKVREGKEEGKLRLIAMCCFGLYGLATCPLSGTRRY